MLKTETVANNLGNSKELLKIENFGIIFDTAEGVCGVLIGKTLEIAGNISFSCRSIDFMEDICSQI